MKWPGKGDEDGDSIVCAQEVRKKYREKEDIAVRGERNKPAQGGH